MMWPQETPAFQRPARMVLQDQRTTRGVAQHVTEVSLTCPDTDTRFCPGVSAVPPLYPGLEISQFLKLSNAP